jgi:hypothetical protein
VDDGIDRMAADGDGEVHSRFIMARASFSTSTKCSPETSTTTCAMVPPVNVQGRVPGSRR